MFEHKFDGRKCNSDQKWNKNKCKCECKNPRKKLYMEKTVYEILLPVVVNMVNM